MKATTFLKKRFTKALGDAAGEQTVQYIKFDPSSKDDATGDVDEALAYLARPVGLPSLVEFSPSNAMRERVGLEIDFHAVLFVSTEHLSDKNISVQLGDAFVLPGESSKYYVVKTIPRCQVNDGFLATMVAVDHQVGRR